LISYSYQNQNPASNLAINWEKEETINARDPQLTLPVPSGETWYFTGGPHERTLGKTGTGSSCIQNCCQYMYGLCTDYCYKSSNSACSNHQKKWNAIDFAELIGPELKVVAKRSGTVRRYSSNNGDYIIIYYNNGDVDDYNGLKLTSINSNIYYNQSISVSTGEILAKRVSSPNATAARDGVVSAIGAHYISIDHAGGWRTTYLHLNTARLASGIKKGASVSRGQIIAPYLVCDYFSINCNHFHFELSKKVDPTDPNSLYENVDIVNYQIGPYTMTYSTNPPRMYAGCLTYGNYSSCNDYYDKLVVQPLIDNRYYPFQDIQTIIVTGGINSVDLKQNFADNFVIENKPSVEAVSQGGMVTFTMSIINKLPVSIKNVVIEILVPNGMSYVDGSLLLNAKPIDNVQVRPLTDQWQLTGYDKTLSARNNGLFLNVGDLTSQNSATLLYTLTVDDDNVGASINTLALVRADDGLQKQISSDLIINSPERTAPVAGLSQYYVVLIPIVSGFLMGGIYIFLKQRKKSKCKAHSLDFNDSIK
jgi:uncharacterized repeat protein (TIGR01451 family)